MCVLLSHSRSVMGGSLIMTVPGLEVYSQTQKSAMIGCKQPIIALYFESETYSSFITSRPGHTHSF